MDVNIESLIHALCMAAWDAGAESGTVWCPDADMSKRGVVPMTQDEGFAHAREHFARHGGGSESSAFDQALAALRAELERIQAAQVVVPEPTMEEWQEIAAKSHVHGDLAHFLSGAANYGIWIRSRLRTAQPGEVIANEEELRRLRLLRRAVNGWRHHDRPATVVLNALVEVEFFESRERERARPTTNEGETPK